MGDMITTTLALLYQIPKMRFIRSYLGFELTNMRTLFVIAGLAGRG
jgi:hypothetical protein